jgi:uncharacterized protein affecting Mg2+/Co2+ transport
MDGGERLGSEAVTLGVRVRVTPAYLAEQSDALAPLHVFGYRIRITNEGREAVTLLSRHWVIVDGQGRREEVRGPGVVGQQPRIEPGQTFDYAGTTGRCSRSRSPGSTWPPRARGDGRASGSGCGSHDSGVALRVRIAKDQGVSHSCSMED